MAKSALSIMLERKVAQETTVDRLRLFGVLTEMAAQVAKLSGMNNVKDIVQYYVKNHSFEDCPIISKNEIAQFQSVIEYADFMNFMSALEEAPEETEPKLMSQDDLSSQIPESLGQQGIIDFDFQPEPESVKPQMDWKLMDIISASPQPLVSRVKKKVIITTVPIVDQLSYTLKSKMFFNDQLSICLSSSGYWLFVKNSNIYIRLCPLVGVSRKNGEIKVNQKILSKDPIVKSDTCFGIFHDDPARHLIGNIEITRDTIVFTSKAIDSDLVVINVSLGKI